MCPPTPEITHQLDNTVNWHGTAITTITTTTTTTVIKIIYIVIHSTRALGPRLTLLLGSELTVMTERFHV